jgi:hypothetical protein
MSRRQIIGLIVGLVVFATGLVVLLGSDEDSVEARAFVESSTGSTALIWAVGDGADGGEVGRSVGGLVGSTSPEHFLYLGDVYETGTAEEFDTNYQPLFGSLNGIAAPTVGNHEEANEDQGYYPFWREAKGTEVPPYYAFVAGGWQILGLNSTEPRGARSEQVSWLRKTLSTGGFGTCRLAFLHHPRYSAGRHGDNRSIEPIRRALTGRATVLLAGHDHNMQRFRPVNGLTQLISGAGGHELYDVNERDPRLLFANDTQYGALRLVLRGNRANASFISVEGTVLDRSRHRCRRGASAG